MQSVDAVACLAEIRGIVSPGEKGDTFNYAAIVGDVRKLVEERDRLRSAQPRGTSAVLCALRDAIAQLGGQEAQAKTLVEMVRDRRPGTARTAVMGVIKDAVRRREIVRVRMGWYRRGPTAARTGV